MKVFLILFDDAGSIATCEEVKLPVESDRHMYVFAPDEASARKQAYNTYCAKKKAEAKVRKQAQGRCPCGRAQDRESPKGGMYKTCMVCAHRQTIYNARTNARHNGTPAVRDEQARLDANASRQRDRRGEITLEVLLRVKKAWESSSNIGQFTAWLRKQIEEQQ